jgi:hypothetical protein
MTWFVTVDGQISEESKTTTTYRTPRILNISNTTMNSITDGGLMMTLTGRDFGLEAASGTLVSEVIWYEVESSTTTRTSPYSSAILTNGMEMLVVEIPEMSTEWHKREVYIQLTGDSDATATVTMDSDSFDFHYSRPVLDSLETAVSSAGPLYINMILSGQNFALFWHCYDLLRYLR